VGPFSDGSRGPLFRYRRHVERLRRRVLHLIFESCLLKVDDSHLIPVRRWLEGVYCSVFVEVLCKRYFSPPKTVFESFRDLPSLYETPLRDRVFFFFTRIMSGLRGKLAFSLESLPVPFLITPSLPPPLSNPLPKITTCDGITYLLSQRCFVS